MSAMNAPPVIPTISTSALGPVGIMHLPRLWLKMLLSTLGRLPPDYKVMVATFDRIVLEALALDASRIEAFVRAERPDYLAFEKWVRDNGKPLTAAEIAALNAHYLAFPMSAAGAAARRAELGLTDESLQSGVVLNDLDDWAALHRQLLAESAGEPVPRA
jgi:hypothetical protein